MAYALTLAFAVCAQASLPCRVAEVQATCLPPRDAETQYQPLEDASASDNWESLSHVAVFLEKVLPE